MHSVHAYKMILYLAVKCEWEIPPHSQPGLTLESPLDICHPGTNYYKFVAMLSTNHMLTLNNALDYWTIGLTDQWTRVRQTSQPPI